MNPANRLLPRRLLSDVIEYKEREEIKRDARRLKSRQGATFQNRCRSALTIIAMWWQRNRDLCPDFEVYASHLITADRPFELGGTLHEYRFGADVVAWLIESYGQVNRCYIDPGFSDFKKRLRPPPRRAGSRKPALAGAAT